DWQKETFGITGTAEHGHFRVSVYNDAVIRVQLARENFFEDFSYAVVGTAAAVSWQVSDNAEAISLSTDSVVLTIRKDRLSFRFANREGVVINEDDESFGTSWIGEQVTTYKRLQPGERFIGLGEKTGPLDRRGFGYTNWNTDNF